MQFSDEDVSVSGSELEEDPAEAEEDVSFSDVSVDDDPTAAEDGDGSAQQQQQQTAAAAAAVSGAAGLAAAAKGSTRGVTDALISGEMSTQTALLQMEVRGTGARPTHARKYRLLLHIVWLPDQTPPACC